MLDGNIVIAINFCAEQCGQTGALNRSAPLSRSAFVVESLPFEEQALLALPTLTASGAAFTADQPKPRISLQYLAFESQDRAGMNGAGDGSSTKKKPP
jgi:hypothetical protein